jgi:hypothetical protein
MVPSSSDPAAESSKPKLDKAIEKFRKVLQG